MRRIRDERQEADGRRIRRRTARRRMAIDPLPAGTRVRALEPDPQAPQVWFTGTIAVGEDACMFLETVVLVKFINRGCRLFRVPECICVELGMLKHVCKRATIGLLLSGVYCSFGH